LYLNLKPKTKYNIKFNWTKKQSFEFVTPENKFFWFIINKKVTLFPDFSQPKFSFYKFNSDKKEAKLKICRIDNQNFAKLETYAESENKKMKEDFFKTGIDKIKTFECHTKNLDLSW
jgi:hypothetical protein